MKPPTHLKIQNLGNHVVYVVTLSLTLLDFFLLCKMMISSSMWVLTWFSPKTPPSWKIFITDVKPIGSMYAICTYIYHKKNTLRIHGPGKYTYNRPMDLLSWGEKNQTIIKGCRLLMRLLRKEGYMVWELKRWNLNTSPPTVGSGWGCFGDGGFVHGGCWSLGRLVDIYIYILLRYTPFSLVWMCRLVWVFLLSKHLGDKWHRSSKMRMHFCIHASNVDFNV